jgi:flagellar biosynthesis protein FlhB
MNKEFIILSLIIGFIIFWFFLSYILKLWPFNKKKIVLKNTKKNSLNDEVTTTTTTNTTNSVVGIILFIILMVIFAIIGYVSFKTSMARYQLADSAIKSGNGGVATAALAPEIGEGIGAGLNGIFNRNKI